MYGSTAARPIGGVYLWETKEATDAFYSDAEEKGFTNGLGVAPVIDFFDAHIVVDIVFSDVVTDHA